MVDEKGLPDGCNTILARGQDLMRVEHVARLDGIEGRSSLAGWMVWGFGHGSLCGHQFGILQHWSSSQPWNLLPSRSMKLFVRAPTVRRFQSTRIIVKQTLRLCPMWFPSLSCWLTVNLKAWWFLFLDLDVSCTVFIILHFWQLYSPTNEAFGQYHMVCAILGCYFLCSKWQSPSLVFSLVDRKRKWRHCIA